MGFLSDVFLIGKQTSEAAKASFYYHNFGKTVLALEKESAMQFMDLFKSMVEAQAILNLRTEFDDFYFGKNDKAREGAIYFLSALIAYILAKDEKKWDWKVIRGDVQTVLIAMKKNPEDFQDTYLKSIDEHTLYIREMYER